MRKPSTDLKLVQFEEYPFIKYDETSRSEWEIISTNNFCTLQDYCKLLLEKIKKLAFVELDQFLSYQCQLVRDPYKWLHSLEALLEQNITCLRSEGLSNYFLAIERCRAKINTAINTNLEQSIVHFYHRHYNIQSIKNRVEELPTYNDKIRFLLEQKTIYLQNKPSIVPPHITPFDKQIELEIEKWKALQMLKQDSEFPNTTYRLSTTLSVLSLIHISEPTRPLYISYAVFCLKKSRN